MINKYNIAELSLVDRPVGGTKSGFGAVLNRHGDNHDQRHFNTTNKDFYGEAAKLSAAETQKGFQKTFNQEAGGNARPFEEQGVHMISNLTGEVYSKSFDPQEQTDVQRAWMYQQDPGVSAVNAGIGGRAIVPKIDNANSLPLATGVHSLQPKWDHPGAYRHMRQDVTLRPAVMITR